MKESITEKPAAYIDVLREADADRLLTWVALAHGFFWLAGGLWALTSRRTFEAITGPKDDYWLVRTVAGLITVGGVVGLRSATRRQVPDETIISLAGGAGVLTAIDVVYVKRRRISPVYLLDALAHIILITGWLTGRLKRRSSEGGSGGQQRT